MSIPKKEINGLVFFPIPEFNAMDMAFGADESSYFNRRDIPEEIPRDLEKMVQKLFFNGGDVPDFHKKVDRKKAFIAINTWLQSFAPAHESKIATVAYAIWLWTHPTALD